jgi:hypothetical protein
VTVSAIKYCRCENIYSVYREKRFKTDLATVFKNVASGITLPVV